MLISFVIPLHKKVLPPVMLLFVVVFIANGGIQRILKSGFNVFPIITSFYYLSLVIGLAYSSNMDAALFDLEVKASLVLLPIVFWGLKVTRQGLYRYLNAFIAGNVIAAIVSLGAAGLEYMEFHDFSVFFYQRLTFFHHPSYFALYLNLCLAIIYYYMLYGKEGNIFKSRIISFSLIAFFSFMIVLLSAKLSMITLVLLLIISNFIWIRKEGKYVAGLVLLVFAILSGIAVYKTSDVVRVRIDEAIASVTTDSHMESTSGARIIIWSLSKELIKDEPWLGYGTGDVKDVLMKKYEEGEYSHLLYHKLNAHSQYFQTLLAVGIPGFIFFLLYLLYPLIAAGFKASFLIWMFTLLCAMNFIPESMLETQAGVVFFAFFTSLFYFNRNQLSPEP